MYYEYMYYEYRILVVYNFGTTISDYRCVICDFKEKANVNLFQDLIHFLKKNRHCMIKLISLSMI